MMKSQIWRTGVRYRGREPWRLAYFNGRSHSVHRFATFQEAVDKMKELDNARRRLSGVKL